jgi:hypothetical protein
MSRFTDTTKGLVELGGSAITQGVSGMLGHMKSSYSANGGLMGRLDRSMNGIRKTQAQIENPLMKLKGENLDEMSSRYVRKNNPMKNMDPGSGTKQFNLFKHHAKDSWKNFKIGTVMSGGLYGLSAYMSDNENASAGDRMANVVKHGVAGTVDVAADFGLTTVAAGLATFGGPGGVVAGGVLMAFNMFAGFAGLDAGSLAMTAMNYADGEYDTAKAGKSKFNMTENTSMAMQRQIQNLHASGSNLGEMMHN